MLPSPSRTRAVTPSAVSETNTWPEGSRTSKSTERSTRFCAVNCLSGCRTRRWSPSTDDSRSSGGDPPGLPLARATARLADVEAPGRDAAAWPGFDEDLDGQSKAIARERPGQRHAIAFLHHRSRDALRHGGLEERQRFVPIGRGGDQIGPPLAIHGQHRGFYRLEERLNRHILGARGLDRLRGHRHREQDESQADPSSPHDRIIPSMGLGRVGSRPHDQRRGGSGRRQAAQDEDRQIIGESLIAAMSLDRLEDGAAQLGCCRGAVRARVQRQRPFESRLVEGRAVRALGFGNPVAVHHERVPWPDLDVPLLVHRSFEHPQRDATGVEPDDRAIRLPE